MGIIECRVRNAFKNFRDSYDLHQFAIEMAHIADYSVRSMTHWRILLNSIHKVKKEDEEKLIADIVEFNNNDSL